MAALGMDPRQTPGNTDEDRGFTAVILTGATIFAIWYTLTNIIELSVAKTCAIMIPGLVGTFITWVRHENAKIAKEEEEERLKAEKKKAGKDAPIKESKKDS